MDYRGLYCLTKTYEGIPFTENPLNDFINCPDQETHDPNIKRAHIVIRGRRFDESLIEHLERVVFLLN